MINKEYERNGETFIIEEMSRKEFIEWATGTIEGIEVYNSEDDTVWVEYKDGSHYSCGYGDEGKFRKTNIEFGVISNAATQQVFGQYEVDENGIVVRA